MRTWLERLRPHLLSRRVVPMAVAMVAVLLLARGLPVGIAVALYALVSIACTLWFYATLVLCPGSLTAGDLVYVVLGWVVAVVWWSLFFELLWQDGTIVFREPGVGAELSSERADVSRTGELFLWNLVDLVPIVDVDGTLRWKEPLDYTSRFVGGCVLVYEVLVVIPVIALIRRVWTSRSAGGG